MRAWCRLDERRPGRCAAVCYRVCSCSLLFASLKLTTRACSEMKRTYDPIATSSTTLSTDTDEREVFSAPGLRLIAVDWAWALALKFVRYAKHDPEDVYVFSSLPFLAALDE